MYPPNLSSDDSTRLIRSSCCTSRGMGMFVSALVLLVVSVIAGRGLARWLQVPGGGQPAISRDRGKPHVLFYNWPEKPAVALFLSGQMHGYMMPCGCSDPQIGGLERRYNFLEFLREKKWPVLPLDLGDVAQKEGPVKLPNLQGMIKYRYTLQAMKTMGYQAVSFGEYEAALPLLDALANWPLQDPQPRFLSANMVEPKDFVGEIVPTWQAFKPEGSPVTVGVTAIVGPSVEKEIKDLTVKFGGTVDHLNPVLKEMAAKKVDLRVLLYHGSMSRGWKDFGPEAEALAKRFPEFDLILCLSESDEPAGNPTLIEHASGKKTMLVSLGHKGKYVGVVGVFPTEKADNPYELRYQLTKMTPYWATPEEKRDVHPVVKLWEGYTAELKRENYLAKVPQSKHPLQVAVEGVNPSFVGSETCKNCHKSAYKVWKNTPHSHAYDTLASSRASHPSNRQFDPECIVCHSVGFAYQGGFVSLDKTPKLKDVGCESCHGPASEHASNPNNLQWQQLLNPWKAPANEVPTAKEARLRRIDQFCQRCHDMDNDVTWINGAFERKWPKIAHPTPDVEIED